MRTKDPRRVVVTGIGLVTPVGTGTEKAWKAILAGESGVSPISRFDVTGLKTTIAAEVKDFNAEDFLDKKSVKRLDLFIKYAVGASKMALEDSGITLTPELSTETACSLGCGLGGLQTMEDNHSLIVQGRPDRISPFFIPMMIGNMSSGIVALELGIRGPNYLCATACAAGAHAIGLGFQLIRDSGYQIVVSGGTESVITDLAIAGFNSLKALSTKNEDPTHASKPFDLRRDGFILGEGAGVLILEERERAIARNAKIYAEVLGFGASCDAFHFTAPPEDGAGAALAMENALKDASSFGLVPEDIRYINAHGTSTGLNDRMESLAIRNVFGEHAAKLAVSSTKSMTGHLLGAAGGVEAAFTVLAIRDGILPPTMNYEVPDPDCNLDYVPNSARKQKLSCAMTNSFGFGGTNGVLIFGAPGAWELKDI
ncbi:MAG: beta-ketoacyl-ACP synthase II [Deltaproteobacteria bacterium]|jgi:3-oxoacyl-[acyl-carrier-protein] synthase II|nr:beta-ketoacyl-ACP synthase II [Deltaproteobacteria bacterium]